MADIFPGARVVEAGVGSGALSMSLLRAIGDDGELVSFERREDFADIARGQRPRLLRPGRTRPGGSSSATWSRPCPAAVEAGTVDRVVLDMLAPWECLDAVADAMVPGGVLICYVATTTQLSRVAEAIREPRRLHRAERLGVSRPRLAPRGSGGPARAPDARAYRLPRHDPTAGARSHSAGAHAPTREGVPEPAGRRRGGRVGRRATSASVQYLRRRSDAYAGL